VDAVEVVVVGVLSEVAFQPGEADVQVTRSALLRPLIASVTDDEITFTNGSVIAPFPC